ncbi:putative protein MSS51 homolog, mitochondrial [Temnothorax nylanderi]|uniref:putative protein MSS51 homolog, mitochondrial n=1 Tax=Temnothorax nylanderi TaxID=102681 RepID=UPI003A89750E
MCHVCKRFGDGVQLKRCRGCKMISYCGQEHQKQHWKQHKPLCKAIQDVLQGRQGYDMNVRGKTSKERTSIKQMFMLLVSRTLKRRLTMCEMQMFKFPRECLICHERNAQSLKVCQKCAASFCQNHKDGILHRNFCAPQELCFRSDLLATKEDLTNSLVPDIISYAKHVFDTMIKFLDMNDFIGAYGVIRDDSDGVLAADHSQYLTRPLTLFTAMRILHYVPESNKDLIIHVVGASCAEEATLIGWEVLPCLLETAMSVTIVMIGPELKYKYNSNACDPCTSSDNKSLIFKYHDVLYENYVLSPLFVKPDLIVGFNLGIHEHELGSERETWAPSIQILAKQTCPFVLTSATQYSFKKETDIINTILNKEVDHLYSGKNPFASLKPYKTIEMEYVSYINQYVIIYRSICS